MPIARVSAVATRTFARVDIEWPHRPSRTIAERQIPAVIEARRPESDQASPITTTTTSHHGDSVSTVSIGLRTVPVRKFLIPIVTPENDVVNQSTDWLIASRNE